MPSGSSKALKRKKWLSLDGKSGWDSPASRHRIAEIVSEVGDKKCNYFSMEDGFLFKYWVGKLQEPKYNLQSPRKTPIKQQEIHTYLNIHTLFWFIYLKKSSGWYSYFSIPSLTVFPLRKNCYSFFLAAELDIRSWNLCFHEALRC